MTSNDRIYALAKLERVYLYLDFPVDRPLTIAEQDTVTILATAYNRVLLPSRNGRRSGSRRPGIERQLGQHRRSQAAHPGPGRRVQA